MTIDQRGRKSALGERQRSNMRSSRVGKSAHGPSLRASVAISAVVAFCLAGALATKTAAASTTRFQTPSGKLHCVQLSTRTGNIAPGVYCAARYIKDRAYDGYGVAGIFGSGRGRIVESGNDILLLIKPGRDATPLGYGETRTRRGFTCVSRTSGLTCRHGNHGFTLAQSHQRFF
jgi:hypothetical protein